MCYLRPTTIYYRPDTSFIFLSLSISLSLTLTLTLTLTLSLFTFHSHSHSHRIPPANCSFRVTYPAAALQSQSSYTCPARPTKIYDPYSPGVILLFRLWILLSLIGFFPWASGERSTRNLWSQRPEPLGGNHERIVSPKRDTILRTRKFQTMISMLWTQEIWTRRPVYYSNSS